MRRESLLKGAAVLTLAGLAIRFLGAAYRLPLSWILGSRGLGIYGVPSQYYAMIFILATAGLPTAIAKLVAERLGRGDRAGAFRIFQISRKILLLAGICGSLALALGARWLIKLGIIQEPLSYLGLLAISPVLIVAPLASAYRGFFTGHQYMTPVALSQFSDQFFNVAGTLLFAYLLLPKGLAWAAAGGNFGSFPGALAGLTMLLFVYHGMKRRGELSFPGHVDTAVESTAAVLKALIRLALPISLASISLAVVGALDNNIIIGGLVAKGVSRAAATARYGQMSQIALPFVNAGVFVAVAAAANLVPAVARALSQEQPLQAGRLLAKALRLVLCFAAPVALVLYLWPGLITGFLFRIPEAGVALRAVSPAVICWSAYLVLAAGLQGAGSPVLALAPLLLGLAVKVGLGVFFIQSGYGVAGAGYATAAGYALAALLALAAARLRDLPLSPWLPIAGTLLSLAPMAAVIWCGEKLGALLGISGLALTGSAGALGLLAYGAACLAFQSIRKEEIKRLLGAVRRRLPFKRT